MINNFPLVNSSLQERKSPFFRRKEARLVKIQQRIKGRVKQIIQDVEKNRKSHQIPKQIVLNYQFVDEGQHRYQTVKDRRGRRQQGRKKTYDNFKRTFNRSRTDWDHNFIGTKYQEKVKQEKKNSIWASYFHRTISENKNASEGSKSVIKINDDLTMQGSNNKTRIEIERTKLSEQQLCRINKIRQKRREKIIYRKSLKDYEQTKQLIKHRGSQYKNLSLAQEKDFQCKQAKQKNILNIWQPFSFKEHKEPKLKGSYYSYDKIIQTSVKISPWDDQASISNFSGVWSGKF